MRKLRVTAATLTMIVVLFSIVGVYLVLDNLTGRAAEGRADRADLRHEITSTRADQKQLTVANQALADQVRSLGKTPVVTPDALPPANVRYIPIPGPRGFPGIDGQTVVGPKGDAVIGPVGSPGASIKGDKGTNGKDGTSPPPAKDGTNGKDSTVPGPQGPGPTDAQTAAAVAAYCDTHNQCKGDTGAQGPPGMDATLPPVPDPTPAP